MEDLTAAQGEVPAGDVEARHEEVAARGRLGEVDDLTHVAFIDIRSRQEETRLGEAAATFMHRDGGHIGSCGHGRDRQPAAKVEVGAVASSARQSIPASWAILTMARRSLQMP